MVASIFLIFIVTIIIGLPIALSIAISVVWPVWLHYDILLSIPQAIRGFVHSADSTPMLAVPLFILSGAIMSDSGISAKLFNFFAFFIGKLKAGMPSVVIVTCLFFGAISGSGAATTAAVGAMAIPVLVKLGYNKIFAGALIASAGGLGVVIPPSVPFVLYGLSSRTSISDLFIAGILPGFLIAFLLIGYAYWYCTKHGEDKELIEKNYKNIRSMGFLKLFKDSFFALLSPVIILGGIYTGIVTPTEAAAISVFYAWCVALFIYKTIKFKDIFLQMKNAVKNYAPILPVIAFAVTFARTLALAKAPEIITNVIANYIHSSHVFLFFIIAIFLFIGMFVDTAPAIVILAPILLPVVRMYGINPIHFGVILVTCLAVGLVSPPFGIDLFVSSQIINEPVLIIGKASIPFILAIILAVVLIALFPQISLILL